VTTSPSGSGAGNSARRRITLDKLLASARNAA
jgi:hypothetical protein